MKLVTEATTTFPTFEKNDLVWFDPGCGYPIPGEVISINAETRAAVVRSCLNQGDVFTVSNFTHMQRRTSEVQNVEDLVQMDELSEPAILWTLKTRYDRSKIYTYIGGILISINPFSTFDIYNVDTVKRYKNQLLGTLPPHLFALGETTYADMVSSQNNQVIVISGESGSGKTEAAKLLMQYLALTAPTEFRKNEPGRRNVTTEQILDATPIMESFGNARTTRNDNSSRFGKYTNVLFKNNRIHGAEITEYLLEKSRVVAQAPGERNFHIFYEMLSGLRPEMKEKFGLTKAEKYFYLNQGGSSLEVPGRSDLDSFHSLQSALEVLGFSSDQQHSIFRILAAILHMGNIYFNRQPISEKQEGVVIGNEGEVQWAAYLLHLDPQQLTQALTVRLTETRDEKVATPLNIDRALDVRDALAKALYTQLFSWLISQINQITYKSDRDSSIALLDIYGFEQFKNNTFEQLCINFANERLHSYYTSAVFRIEQSEYSREKLDWNEKIGSQLDNQPVIDLLTKRPHGIFQLLDDESCFPKGSDESFLQKCHYNHIDNPNYSKPRMHDPEFCVRHYAGAVWYEVPGFLDKNRDVMKPNLVELLTESQNPIIAQMFTPRAAQNGTVNFATDIRALSAKPRSTTVVSSFNENLTNLIQKMTKCAPHFIRCMKPNNDKSPNSFDMQLVYCQVRYMGIMDTAKIRRFGYPIRYNFRDFVNKFRILSPKEDWLGKDEKVACQLILAKQAALYSEQYQVGSSKIFLKDQLSEILDKCRERRLHSAAIMIQKNVRSYLHKRKYKRMRIATVKLQSCLRGWRARVFYKRLKSELFRDAEQEAKHSRQLQMYERMRSAANFEEKAQRKLDHALTGVNYLDIPADLSFNLNTMEEWDLINRQERVVRTSADVSLSERHLTVPHDLPNFPFAKFAQGYFKGHLWQMRREPITTPFLPKDNEDDFKDSLIIFKLILRYMNNVGLTPTQEATLANYIVQKGICNEILRDEIYVQLVNQTHGNGNQSNQERGWWLISLCASAFPPSPGLFKFLLNYVMNAECENYKAIIQKKLLQSVHMEAACIRRYPPCLLEHKTIQQKGRMALEGLLTDGSKKKCQVEAWTTANEFAGAVLKQRGVSDSRGWTVSFDSADVEIQLNGSDYLFDVLSYYELPRDFPALKSEFLIWAKPMTAEKREEKLQKLAKVGITNGGLKNDSVQEKLDSDRQNQNGASKYVKFNGAEQQGANDKPILSEYQKNIEKTELASTRIEDLKMKGSFDVTKVNGTNQAPQADYSAVRHMKQTQSSIVSHKLPNELPDAILPPGASRATSTITDMDPVYGRSRALPSEYSVRSMASHVRNVAIPSKNSDVDKFLDDLFEPVLHDTTLEDLYEANSLAASIKGGVDSAVPNGSSYNQSNQQMPGFSLVPTMNQPMIMMVPMDTMRMLNVQQSTVGMQGGNVNSNQQTQMNNVNFATMLSNGSVMQQGGCAMPTFMSPMGQFANMGQMSTMGQMGTMNQMGGMNQVGCQMSPMSPANMSALSFIPMQLPNMFPMSMLNGTQLNNNHANIQVQSHATNHSMPIITSPGTTVVGGGDHSPQSIPPEPTYPPPAPIPPQPSSRAPEPYNLQVMDERAKTVRVANVRWPPPPKDPSDVRESNNFAEFKRKQRDKREHDTMHYDQNYSDEYYEESRRGRMFTRGPPTTITEETSDGSDIEQRTNGQYIGTLKPTTNSARYVGPIPEHFPEEYEQYHGSHEIRDIASRARENLHSLENFHPNYVEPEPMEKTVRYTDPALSPPANFGKPPPSVPPANFNQGIQPQMMPVPEPRNQMSNKPVPNKLPFTRYQSEEQRLQEEALAKMRQNASKLPPPIDKIIIKRQGAPATPVTPIGQQMEARERPELIRSNETFDNTVTTTKTLDERVEELKAAEMAQLRKDREAPMRARHEKDIIDEERAAHEEDKRLNQNPMFGRQRFSNGFDRESMQLPPIDYDESERGLYGQNGTPGQYGQNGQNNVSFERSNKDVRDRFYQEDKMPFGQPIIDDGFDDWIQEDIQLPPYRENKYYFDGRAVPMNEQFSANAHLRPLDYDVGFGQSEVLGEFPSMTQDRGKSPERPRSPRQEYTLSKDKKKTSVFTYDNAPWTLKVRKELFYPNETLDEDESLDLVFYQVISDCLEPNPFRIKRNERDQVFNHLRSYDLDPQNLKNAKLSASLKRTVVDMARSWPLYFCKMFPVVEDRESEYVAQLLGISETGVRLVIRSYTNVDEPLKVLDHFDFEDIDKVDLPRPNLLVLTTLNGLHVRVFTPKSDQIKNLIDEFLFGPNQGKQYVRAVADYVTKEPNLLNFHKGDIIQLITNMQESYMGSGWLYGKVNNRFGNFPSDYIESLNEQPIQEEMQAELEDFETANANGAQVGPPKGKLTMMEFAMMYFRQAPQKYDIVKTDDGTGGTLKVPGKKSKKEWTWKEIADMVKFTKAPIQSSLLRLETAEHNKLAVESFIRKELEHIWISGNERLLLLFLSDIMMFMGDYPLKKDMTMGDPVYKLLTICEKRPSLRDEIYCQIMKQTTNNKSSKPDSAILGWRLFSIFTAYFDSSDVLKPYLIKYLSEAANDTRRAYHGTAMISLQNLKQTFKYGGRKSLLSFREIESITNGKNLKRQVYHLPGGTKKVINTKSVTVVEEVIQELCQELNIRSPLEQQEFCLCYVIESENVMKLLSNDEYILDISTDLEYKKKDYFLLLKRTVWIHPLRLDNELYIDVTFFQVVPDYLEGLLVIMKSAETISAAFMDDIARLGALLHSADEHWDGQLVNSRTVAQVLPRIVQNLRHISLEQWADRINAKLRQLPANINTTQARAKFLDILQTWPLFGSTFFYIMNVTDSRIQDECLLAINKNGVQFLHIVTHETLLEFRLNEILSTHKVTAGHPMGGPPMQFLDLKVGNLLQQRVISLQTEQGAEISRLLGQYIYVDSQNRGFIQGDGGN